VLAKPQVVVQLAIGFVFLLSTAGKLRNPRSFIEGVVDYRVLPASLALFFGMLVIPLEFWLALAHLTGWTLNLAVPIGLILLVVFAVAITVNLLRGRILPCHCFGASRGESISRRSIGRVLLLASGEAFLIPERSFLSRQSISFPASTSFFWAAILLITASWLLNVGDLFGLFMPGKSKI
jgi:hypothetical protein